MQLNPLTVPSDTLALEAIQLMHQNQTGVVLVVDEQELKGIFTERDVITAVATGVQLEQVSVAILMTQPVITLDRSEAANHTLILERLSHHQICYLPVLNSQEQVIGLVTPESIYQIIAQLQQIIEARTFELSQEGAERQRLAQLLAQAEVDHWASEVHLGDILDHVIAAIGCLRYFDAEHYQVIFRSAGHEVIFGYTVQELIDDPLLWRSRVPPEDLAILFQQFNQAISTGQIITAEYRFHHKDGSLRWISGIFAPQWDEVQHCWIVSFVEIDITSRKQAEVALHQSEARFRAIFEHAGIGIAFLTPPHYKLEQTNPKFQQMLGYSAAELANLDYSHITHPDDLQREQSLVQQVLAGNTEIYILEKRYIRQDGQTVWVNLINSVLRDATGEIEFAIGLVEDITNRKRTEQEIQFQANLLNQVHNAVICTDLEGRVIYWNRFAELLYQWAADQVMGKVLVDCIVPVDQREAMAAQFAALVHNQQGEGEYLLQRRDGSTFSAMAAASPIWDEQGQVMGFVGVSMDISDRKQAEEKLKASEKRLSLAISAAKAGTWEWNSITDQAFWSDETFRLLGYTPGSCEMNYDNWLRAVHPDEQEPIEAALQQALAMGTNLNLEYRVLLPDGSVRWISDIGEVIRDDQGNPTGMIGFQIDITERKQTEAQIQASLQEKEVLLKEMHHRVKNNLQIVSSLLNLQADWIEDPQIRKIFQDSWSRIDSMALVHESLYQSQNFSSINFSDYVQALAAHLIQSYSLSDQVTSTIEIEPQVSLSLGQAIPCGLLLNELITNALKHGIQPGQSGEIVIQLFQVSSTCIMLTVDNSGDTLPADFDLDLIQSMGMNLVLNLIEQLEGTLELERGAFTLFQISFNPAVEEEISALH